MANAYHHDGLGLPRRSIPARPAATRSVLSQRFQALLDLTDWFTLVPGLIGVLLAAPFIFDLEHGTYRLAWTQSITRRRWLLGKLGAADRRRVVAAGALDPAPHLVAHPSVHLDGRLDNGDYDTEGTVAIGYTLFALGLRSRWAPSGGAPPRRSPSPSSATSPCASSSTLAPRPPRPAAEGNLEGHQPGAPQQRPHPQQRSAPPRPPISAAAASSAATPSSPPRQAAAPSSRPSTSPRVTSGLSSSPRPASSSASPRCSSRSPPGGPTSGPSERRALPPMPDAAGAHVGDAREPQRRHSVDESLLSLAACLIGSRRVRSSFC